MTSVGLSPLPVSETSLLCAAVPGSSLHDWTRGTLDAAVMAPGLCEDEVLAVVPTGSVLKRWDPLNGLNCQEFIGQYINYNLQDHVGRQLHRLSADDLGRLGAHHFGDQADELQRLLEQKSLGNEPKEFKVLKEPQEKPRQETFPTGHRGAIGASTVEAPPEQSTHRAFPTPQARVDFVQKHIHRKLQSCVGDLSDEDLRLLGLLHFSDQPAELQRFQKPRPRAKEGYEESPAAVCGERWHVAPEAETVQWRSTKTKADGVEGLAGWLTELGLEEYEEVP